MVKLSELVIIPLWAAFLCADLDCQTVSINPHHCPVCHSHVISLAWAMDRKEAA